MKKISTLTLATLLSANLFIPSVGAEENVNYFIDSLSEFSQESKEIMDKKKASKTNQKLTKINNSKSFSYSVLSSNEGLLPEELTLIKNTSPEVLNQYNELLEEEISVFSIADDENLGGNSKVTYTLPKTGAEITVVTSNELVELAKTPQNKATVQSLQLIRSFGTYSYKIAYSIRALLYPDSTCGLVTTYTTRSDGLRLTGHSTSGTSSIFPTAIKASSQAIDSRAEKIGYDINAMGLYNVTVGGYNGIGLMSFDMSITSKVRWDASTSTGLKVTQTYSQVGDKSR
ncbi:MULTISPECIES: hypothetical protein [unclassified Exiguobacterium]|uniref:hypothetical protein n=1 Tax=unclassified Exiguobacterium TaxID=2644629 RepID=UPI001BE7BDF1|nr:MULTISPECIES: hypothetical protein [unclassified Exiguobacterium]